MDAVVGPQVAKKKKVDVNPLRGEQHGLGGSIII
jgi:hypothetical protein